MKYLVGICGSLLLASIGALLSAIVADSYRLDSASWGISSFLMFFCIAVIISVWSNSAKKTLSSVFMCSGLLLCLFPFVRFLPTNHSGSLIEQFVNSRKLFWGLAVGFAFIIIGFLVGQVKGITSTSTNGSITPQSQ